MYPLYELVRLISFGHGSRATLAPKVAIVDFAWREVGEANMLALVCSNGYVVLRCCISGKEPTIRQLPWHDDRPIVSLCFDPTATWLLILTSDSELYIVPALSLLEPGARVNQLWQVDDVTSMGIIPQPKEPSVLCWWHTLDDYQVALVGTKQGKVVCVDLRRRRVLTEVAINGAVSGLSLIQDDDQMSTHLLITLEEGQQLKVLLECQNSAAYRRKISEVDWTDVGYDPVESDIVSLIHQTESNKHLFYPLKFYQFKPSVQLSPQYAKGRHFIGCHDSKTCQYQIMDSGLEQSALFVYQAPEGAYNLIFSDKVTFCTTDADVKKLSILSNQKAETSMTDKQVFNKDAIFQQFSLPEGEELKAVLKKSFPFYWHEKREEMGRTTPQPIADIERVSHDGEAESIPISSHTVMDGCIVITDTSVYECRPRVSPERLFLDFAIHHSDPSVAESLGIGLGLDVNSLFERVAEYKLTKGEFHQAIRLYQLSKCSHAKRVASFASHGCIPEVMTYLKQVLTNQKTDVNTGEKKPLADMALYCFVHQIQGSGTASGSVLASFRDFLLGSFSYNEKTALKLLAKHRLNDLLLELAKARGLILEALQVMVEDGRFDISTDAAQSLVSRGFGAHLARVNEGAFLRCMNPCEMAALLCTKPYLAVSHLDSLEPTLPHLDETHLVNLARIFDPSKPLIGAALNRGHAGRNRTASVNSLASFTSEFGDALSQESAGPDVTRLVHFFLSIVLMLNKKRGPPKEVRLLAAMEGDPVSDYQMKREDSSSGHLELALRPSPIGCGSQHAALVRNGDLYTWGRSHAGRLGHGDLSPDHSICAATRVESLHMLQIRVISVACGGEHTLALTQQGVYGWGSSRFGQVGAGTRDQSYSRPMLLEGLSEQGCVSIHCGHYHSLALTASGSVYSWGWGVHGQLGHGTAEDCLVPTRIQALSAHMVTSVAGGHCHTVALTAQGEVYTFGCGLFGQLGHGSGFKESLPRKVQDLPGKVLQVATKCFHTLALLNNNRVYSWGSHPMVLRQTAHMIKRSRSGAGGHHQGDVVDQFLVPCPVDMSYVHGKIAQVSCGSYHNTLLTTEGEVYVWGRNIDGQLGNGSRQDVKHPVMLTSVNDRSISHMACGSEFNIAMDTDALIWVWGKNEAGQLGMGRPENQPHTTVRPGRKHAASAMYDVIQPTTLTAIPPVTITTSWQRVARSLSVDSTDSGGPLVWSLGGYEDSDPQLYLPELETVSSPCYSTKVIHVILKHLGERCNLSRLSRECVDLRDWLSAAEVHIYQQHYPQALGYTFRHLSSERQNLGNLEEFLSLTEQVLDFHIRELEQYPLPSNQQFLSWRLILLKVFQFWEENKLPVCHLETTLTSHMDVFIAPLGLILFRADESGKSIGVSQRIRKQLKTKFLLTVLSKFLEMIKGEEISGEVSQAFGECLNPGDSPESSAPSLSSGSKLIPYDRLWHEVLQNVRKDWDMHNYVYLTARDIELLQTPGKRRGMVSAGEVIDGSELKNADESSVVVFSCGHHSNSRTFHSDLVQSLNRDLGMGQNALPKTASLLTQCYNRKGFIPMACPGCVVKAVQAV